MNFHLMITLDSDPRFCVQEQHPTRYDLMRAYELYLKHMPAEKGFQYMVTVEVIVRHNLIVDANPGVDVDSWVAGTVAAAHAAR